ncbi:MAG: M23 family metallopeptidase [Pseudonocardiaceae bacterium]
MARHRAGAHRIAVPSAATRGRVVVAAVAAGAFVAAGQGMGAGSPDGITSAAVTPLASGSDAAGSDASDGDAASQFTGTGGAAPAVEVLPITRSVDTDAVPALAKGERIVAEREAEASRPRFALPAVGAFTSGFGARWGTSHLGIDLANAIGTPILAAADGVVLESGPASGFGMWVRLGHADGTTTVYGHINRSLVEEGQEVRAGDEIAEMGNRGQSTGPHLHFEVWNADGEKINPLVWLAEHSIDL